MARSRYGRTFLFLAVLCGGLSACVQAPPPIMAEAAVPAPALAPVPAGVEAARADIAAAMAADHIPGMSVAVWRGEELIWAEGFGSADLEQQVPATAQTLFRYGSVAKPLTATLAARLAQRQLIDLDRNIRLYLPEWPERHPPITLRQLLGHLAGIRHYGRKDFDPSASGGMIDWRLYRDRDSILSLFAQDDLVSAPGEKFHYSTFGYTLAGLVMEAATGKDFGTLLREHVLVPGAVDDIYVDDRLLLIPNRSEAYDPASDYRGVPEAAGPVVNAYTLNSAYKVPGGGLVGDAGSLARFGALHFAPGFVREDIYRQLFTVQRTAAGEPTGTGLGWRIATDPAGRQLFHHSGSQQGSRAHLSVYPEQRLSVAILSNLGNRPDKIFDLAASISAHFLDSH